MDGSAPWGEALSGLFTWLIAGVFIAFGLGLVIGGSIVWWLT